MKLKNLFYAGFGLLMAFSTLAADEIIRLETLVGARVPFYYMKRDGATATLILLPGGLVDSVRPLMANRQVRTFSCAPGIILPMPDSTSP